MVSSFASKYLKSSYRALSLLDQPCLSLSQFKQIQSHLIVSGTIADPFAAGKLLAGFAVPNYGDVSHVYALFRFIPSRSTYMWNTMIRTFAENGQPMNAILLSKEMIKNGFLLNNYTFSFVFRACSEICDVYLGLVYHGHVIKLGWECHDFVLNGLVHCYASCDYMGFARTLLDVRKNPDVITWTAVVNGYVKSGDIGLARELFDQMPEKNAVSWSAMMNGYLQFGHFKKALDLFNDMQVAGVQPNHAAIVGALSACGFLGALDHGRWIHAYVNRNRFTLDRVLGTALVDMYAKCGIIEMACHVFEKMSSRDVFTYTSLISGLANHDLSGKAIEVFKRMLNEGIKPNEVTFICILNACSRMGLVEEGLRIFENMKRVYEIEPAVEHFGCLVDLLGRAGMLELAKEVVRTMPMEPDSYVLGALLNACRVHGEINLGEEIVKILADHCLDHDGVHVLLSNIYATVKKWDYVETVRKGMDKKKAKKEPGCSLIELDGMVFEFFAGDKSHDHIEDINFVSLRIDLHLKCFGHDEYDHSIE
ncbi:hypothetical protein M9H77_05102 [Catharanthus roseus]|uniref:Uncharacterized protein n=1 Tax=Catharanthus roseus TaxID=4058 RepID=A0ACC0CG59_CATRO|nr:hypothetical protein M9H77_05102 [Catharanthus roseus]